MDELLKKLLEAEILSEETQKELSEAFNKKLEEAVEAGKKEAADAIRVELAEQWLGERDALVEAIDQKVNEFLEGEMAELHESIAAFRDLETEMAAKLVEEKHKMSESVTADMAELLETLNVFLEERIAVELTELKENIDEVRELEFGRNIFEAFTKEYRKFFVDADSVEAELHEAQESVKSIAEKYKQVADEKAELERTIKLEQVLKPLSGRQREIMETILKSLPTEQLDEGYKTFIGRVVKESKIDESKEEPTEKETKVLAEGKTDKSSSGVVKTGDTEGRSEEKEEPTSSGTVSLKENYRRLAGLAD